MTAPIPSTHVDTETHPEQDQFEKWRQAVVGYEVSRPDEEPDAPFKAKVDAWSAGAIAVVRGRFRSGLRFVSNDPSRQPRNYSFILLLDGAITGELNGQSLTIGQGQIAIFDWTKPATVNLTPNESLVVVIPKNVLDFDLAGARNLHGAFIEGTAGRILTEYLLSLVRELASARLADADILSSATIKMIAACLSSLPVTEADPASHIGPAIWQRTIRHIEARMHARDLTVATISRDLGISRSTLYRAFSSTGGVAGYIQVRRLEAAHSALSDKQDVRSVKEVAAAFGFASAAHFNTAFSKQFGYRPGEARRGAAVRDVENALDSDMTPEARLRNIVARLSRR